MKSFSTLNNLLARNVSVSQSIQKTSDMVRDVTDLNYIKDGRWQYTIKP